MPCLLRRRRARASNRFRIALGSAAEVTGGVDAALALGYLADGEAAAALALADRVRALTCKLAR